MVVHAKATTHIASRKYFFIFSSLIRIGRNFYSSLARSWRMYKKKVEPSIMTSLLLAGLGLPVTINKVRLNSTTKMYRRCVRIHTK